MSKEKLALQHRIATLEKQLKTAEACQIHGLHFASPQYAPEIKRQIVCFPKAAFYRQQKG